MTAREEQIGDETVLVLEHTSNLLEHIEHGDWRSASDITARLRRTLSLLAGQLGLRGHAEGQAVAAYVAEHSRHTRIGAALAAYSPAMADVRLAVITDAIKASEGGLSPEDLALKVHAALYGPVRDDS